MVGLQPAVYFIRNAANRSLAINFNGVDERLTVERFNDSASQMWIVRGRPDTPQSISPFDAPGDNTRPDGAFVEPTGTPPPYEWHITGKGEHPVVYTVANAEVNRFAGVTVLESGQLIVLAPEGTNSQKWYFECAIRGAEGA